MSRTTRKTSKESGIPLPNLSLDDLNRKHREDKKKKKKKEQSLLGSNVDDTEEFYDSSDVVEGTIDQNSTLPQASASNLASTSNVLNISGNLLPTSKPQDRNSLPHTPNIYVTIFTQNPVSLRLNIPQRNWLEETLLHFILDSIRTHLKDNCKITRALIICNNLHNCIVT